MLKSLLAAAAVAALFAAPAFANEEPAKVEMNANGASVSAGGTKVEMNAGGVSVSTGAVEEAKEVTLKDGTKVEIVGDVASVVAADGTKTVAPDGDHELADGTKLTVKEGKVVAPAAPEAAPAAK